MLRNNPLCKRSKFELILTNLLVKNYHEAFKRTWIYTSKMYVVGIDFSPPQLSRVPLSATWGVEWPQSVAKETVHTFK